MVVSVLISKVSVHHCREGRGEQSSSQHGGQEAEECDRILGDEFCEEVSWNWVGGQVINPLLTEKLWISGPFGLLP
jgi:hypothetical protein